MGRSVRRPTESHVEDIVGINRRNLLKAAGGAALLGTVPGQSAAVGSTVANGATVYAGDMGKLGAIDAETGEEVWINDNLDGRATVLAQTAVGGTVYAANGFVVHAIDAATGEEQWRADANGFAPTIVDDTLYIASEDQLMQALDPATGEQVWGTKSDQFSYETGRSAPNVVGGTVYIGTDFGRLYAIDASNGEVKWKFVEQEAQVKPPTAWKGTVYAAVNGKSDVDARLYAVDATNGEKRWEYVPAPDDNWSFPLMYGPIVWNGTVYVGHAVTGLYAVDATDGTEQWTFEIDGGVDAHPTIADGTVYATRSDERLYAVDAETGDEQWVTNDVSPEGVPTVHGNTVYVPGVSALWAVATDTGKLKWHYEKTDTLDISSYTTTVLADPEDGHSVDSAVNLGTVGHHDAWAQQAVALTAAFTISPEMPTAGDDVTFDAGQSTGNIETYEWKVSAADGFPAEGETITHAFAEGGEYKVTLTVTDSAGETTSTTETITVEESTDEQTETATETDQETTAESDEATTTTTETDQATATITETDDATATTTETDQETTTDQETETSDDASGETETGNLGVPGFGIPAPLAALAGASYLLKRRLTDQEEDT